MDNQKKKQIDKLLKQTSNNTPGMRGYFAMQYSGERTDELFDLKPSETNLLIKFLMNEANKSRKKMISKIIHNCCLMEFTDRKGQPDYVRINAFVEHIGSNNRRKKNNVNKLTWDEALKVLNQVTSMTKKHLAK